MTEQELRKYAVDTFKKWVGKKESDGSHRVIIDIYNSNKPLPRGYKVKYTDPWCATAYSSCMITAGLKEITPIECGCNEMIKLAKSMGIWVEDDTYVPKIGDAILYDWNDSGANYKTTDNLGYPGHIGMITMIDNLVMNVIEGNKNDAVGYRLVEVNGRYIRGYITPKFSSLSTPVSYSDVAKDVIDGKYGNGLARKEALNKAGYNYNEVQALVNEMLRK